MKTPIILAVAALSILTACKTTKTYRIYSKSGSNVEGTATFTQTGKNVEMDLMVYRLSPGPHAVHIHEKGDCSSTDASSAGGHWNPANDQHGKWDSAHFHMGDIGNITARQDGTVRFVFDTDKWCLGCSDESKNIYGKSLIIHAAPDDFHTQPTGNAGGRVACVEIKK